MVAIQIDRAMEVLRELLDRRDRGEFTDAEFFHMVAERGPLGCVEIEQNSAPGAGVFRKVYKPSRNLEFFMAAVAARNGNLRDEGDLASDHARESH